MEQPKLGYYWEFNTTGIGLGEITLMQVPVRQVRKWSLDIRGNMEISCCELNTDSWQSTAPDNPQFQPRVTNEIMRSSNDGFIVTDQW